MSLISSPHNQRLKAVKRLHTKRGRAHAGTFVAEGEDLIAAARRSGACALEGFRVAGSDLGENGFHDVERSALSSVSSLGSGARVIAVYAQRWTSAAGPMCVYLHGVGDPGNVGTVLRGAHAFGASCVALGPGSADPHSPKAVRASMGAIFAVALARVERVEQLPGRKIALVAGTGAPLSGLRSGRAGAVTLLVGAEREGLPEEVVAACDEVAHIPIAAESLNAAMAATVALYEMTKTTRPPGRGTDTVRAS